MIKLNDHQTNEPHPKVRIRKMMGALIVNRSPSRLELLLGRLNPTLLLSNLSKELQSFLLQL
jgi:hypothetical protein